MRRVPLTCIQPPGYAYLRELRGDDEEAVEDVDTWTAIALVDRLLVDAPGAAVRPGEARRLCAADRDRILAAIYVREVGAQVQATPTCPACEKTFDVDFRLDELTFAIAPTYEGVVRRDDGKFQLEDGTCFRVPSGEDELVSSAASEPSAALLARCVESGNLDIDRLGELLERLAPVIDVAIDATCAECGHEHAVRFDVQSFLLGRILAERALRASEVHRIARSYGWSLGEILGMPRSRRRSYVELVEREARA